MMEVPYEREAEEVAGEDLQTRRRSSISHHPTKSNSSTSRSDSSNTSDSSSDTSNIFEYSLSMNTNTNSKSIYNSTITNGENPKIIEGRSVVEVLSDANEEEANFGEPNVAQNKDTNGFTVHQNGVGVDEFSIPESNGGDKETDVELDVSSFSKSPEPSVGLQFVLDENSNGVHAAPPEIYNGENIVNKSLVIHGQNEIVETGQSQDVEQEVDDEYDVEGVIQKQESHDFYCPNCKSCITKRVILKRRKRKWGKISEDEPNPGQTAPHADPKTDEKGPVTEHPAGEKAPGARFDAISCFSCFSIFVPKGDGFLCWRFKPKPAVTMQPGESGDPLTGSMDSGSQPLESKTAFPLWILTCCQPYHTKKPVPMRDSEFSQTSISDTSVPDTDRLKPQHAPMPGAAEVPTHEEETTPASSDDTMIVHKPLASINPGDDTISPLKQPPVTPDEEKNFPLWIVTCCQPTSEEKKQEHPQKPGLAVPPKESGYPPPSQGTQILSSPELSSTPDHDTALPYKPLTNTKPITGTHVPSDTQTLVTSEGTVFPLWFLTCCQPSVDSNKPKPAVKPEDPVLPPAIKTQSISEGGTGEEYHEREPPLALSDETAVLPKQEPPLISESDAGPLVVPKPDPDDDILSPLEPPAPGTPPKGGEVIVPIPDETPDPLPAIPLPNSYGTGPIPDINISLLPHQPEPPRLGVSGLDIIKAIVYGGLLECITSLSVITSAAGGDATTLNIVALGLANVFGGLILLLHNLRVLKHEHATERYEDQLGRPGHYLLHAVVAVISYLVFGLMSPVIYGFAFRKSDNKDYKLATLAAASLVCIAFLSIGKAYVRRPPKAYIQTVFYYISMGFMVSGAGYVAGDLINMLLKKLGVFDSKAPVTMPAFEAGKLRGAWSSY